MRKKHPLFIGLLVLLFCVASPVLSYAEESKDKGDTAEPIEASAGREFVIILDSNKTAGFSWQLVGVPDKSVVEFIGSKYIMASPRLMGACGREIWTFKATGAGTALVSFQYLRPWEKDVPAVKKKDFLITVKDALPQSKKQ